jgi:hypothetical protein
MAAKQGVRRMAAVAGIVIAGVTSAGSARADATCIAAYEQTQTLRKDGKPGAAKAQAAICARDSCPALLTKDCTKWLAELEPLIPSVILDPRAPAGGVRTDVRVKLDGAALSEKIDGKPMVVEPGSHTFVFEAEGAAPVERILVVREGEKNKKVTVTMAPPVTAVALERPIPLGVWIFGALSVVALGTAGVFALDGIGKKSDLDACKPHCSAEDVDAMSTQFTFADVALGAGVMAGAAAAYLFFTRPAIEAAQPGVASTGRARMTRMRPVPFAAPLSGGGAFGLTGRF